MSIVTYNYKRAEVLDKKSGKVEMYDSLSKTTFETFNERVLGLGNVAADGTYYQALVAVLDLKGFTHFCNQPDSHLVIPDFLSRYLRWVFLNLRQEALCKEENELAYVWNQLPFFVKFLGDGLLIIWDTKMMARSQQTNVVIGLQALLSRYKNKFLPEVKKHVSNPPDSLRCGIAKGQVISIGNGQDFVGSCINIASRLQKLSNLNLAISRRGFDFTEKKNMSDMIVKQVTLDGIGSEELVYVTKKEFDNLKPTEKSLFKDP